MGGPYRPFPRTRLRAGMAVLLAGCLSLIVAGVLPSLPGLLVLLAVVPLTLALTDRVLPPRNRSGRVEHRDGPHSGLPRPRRQHCRG